MEGRKGKMVFAARLKGIGRKALSRRRRKCPLDQDHKELASVDFQTAATIAEVQSAIQAVLKARTSEIPPCRNIQKMIGRKVNKIAKRLNGQTRD